MPAISEKLGAAYVEIKADQKHFVNGMKSARGTLSKFSSAAPVLLKGATLAIAGLGAAATAASAVVSAFVVKGTRDYGAFGHEMATVSTMIRENVDENTKALQRGVRDLATDIPQSTSILTTALYDILSASVPVSESLEMLELSGKAAVAGVSDVQTAANLATGTLNALGMSFSEADRMFDLAFSTVAEGKVTFEELAASIGRALPATKKMHASAAELYGSMAFLTKNALNAEMAATALGAAYEALQKKSVPLEGMGIRVFGEEGEYRGIVAVIEDIAEVLDGLTEQAQVNVLEEMGFERQAARAIVTMALNLEAFRKTMVDVADSAGATEEAYDKMKDTMINQWAILKNNIKELGFSIGEEFAEGTSAALGSITGMVRDINTLIAGSGGLSEVWALHGDVITEAMRYSMASGLILVKEAGGALGDILEHIWWPEWKKTFKSWELDWKKFVLQIMALLKMPIKGYYAVLEEIEEIKRVDLEAWWEYEASLDDVWKNLFDAWGERAANATADVGESFGKAKKALSDAADNIDNLVGKTGDLEKATGDLKNTNDEYSEQLGKNKDREKGWFDSTEMGFLSVTNVAKGEFEKRSVLHDDYIRGNLQGLSLRVEGEKKSFEESTELAKTQYDEEAARVWDHIQKIFTWWQEYHFRKSQLYDEWLEKRSDFWKREINLADTETEHLLDIQNKAFQIQQDQAKERVKAFEWVMDNASNLIDENLSTMKAGHEATAEQINQLYRDNLAVIETVYADALGVFERHGEDAIELERWKSTQIEGLARDRIAALERIEKASHDVRVQMVDDYYERVATRDKLFASEQASLLWKGVSAFGPVGEIPGIGKEYWNTWVRSSQQVLMETSNLKEGIEKTSIAEKDMERATSDLSDELAGHSLTTAIDDTNQGLAVFGEQLKSRIDDILGLNSVVDQATGEIMSIEENYLQKSAAVFADYATGKIYSIETAYGKIMEIERKYQEQLMKSQRIYERLGALQEGIGERAVERQEELISASIETERRRLFYAMTPEQWRETPGLAGIAPGRFTYEDFLRRLASQNMAVGDISHFQVGTPPAPTEYKEARTTSVVVNVEHMYGGDEASLNRFAEDIARRIGGQGISI